jgi:threonine dehydrogenase-like Zn-dependent dehydrogenase
MKALVFERKVAKFAAAAVAGRIVAGRGAKHGPLTLKDVDPPSMPAAGWVRFRPRLAGICGSDLATIDGQSSRYFEPIVSFPFTLGHEVVGDLDDGTRAVLIPVLHCATRGVEPPCDSCRAGRINHCERIAISSRGCRAASARAPAAVGRSRWAPTRASCSSYPTPSLTSRPS